MIDASINIAWYGVPCHCHCQHCLVNSGQKISTIPYKKAQDIVKSFIEWRDVQREYKPIISFAVGYSTYFDQLKEHFHFLRYARLPANDFLQVGGLRKKSGDELCNLIDSFLEAGIHHLGFSFFGSDGSHDEFAGREGDFKFLLDIARAWIEQNHKVSVVIFLTRNNIIELPNLIKTLGNIHVNKEDVCLRPLGYKGRAKFLEVERPLISDLISIPETIQALFDKDKYKTEEEWFQTFKLENIPRKKELHYFIPIWEENIDWLEATSPDIILSTLRESHNKYISSMPPFETLASLYGNQSGQCLYKLEDLEHKWRDLYIQNNPEIKTFGQFDELSECVMIR